MSFHRDTIERIGVLQRMGYDVVESASSMGADLAMLLYSRRQYDSDIRAIDPSKSTDLEKFVQQVWSNLSTIDVARIAGYTMVHWRVIQAEREAERLAKTNPEPPPCEIGDSSSLEDYQEPAPIASTEAPPETELQQALHDFRLVVETIKAISGEINLEMALKVWTETRKAPLYKITYHSNQGNATVTHTPLQVGLGPVPGSLPMGITSAADLANMYGTSIYGQPPYGHNGPQARQVQPGGFDPMSLFSPFQIG